MIYPPDAGEWYIGILKTKIRNLGYFKWNKKQGDLDLVIQNIWVSHQTCSCACVCIYIQLQTVLFYSYSYDMILQRNFKVKHKVYIAWGSDPPLPQWRILGVHLVR